MMKKLLPLSAVVVGAMVTGQAHATATVLPTSGIITPLTCEVLSNNVTIQTSENVYASFNCTTTQFKAATCHSNGTNKTTTQTCSWTSETVNNTTTYTPNFSACGTTPPGDGTVKKVEYIGRVGFRGQSGGGRVGEVELTQATCDTTTVLTLVPDFQ